VRSFFTFVDLYNLHTMKFPFIIFMISFSMFFPLQAQKLNKKIIDTKTQKEILYGYCNQEGLKSGEFGEFYKIEYKNYIPDSNILIQLKPLFKRIKIKIVMGSWCEDSQQQIPRFMKLLNNMKFKTNKMEILCIDHFFKAENFEKGTNKIEKVPTFIIYKKTKEIGRIIETPILSLEKDLLEILKKLQANKN
jgi:hypothetical protein